MEDTGRISGSLGEMSSEEYEVARILINMKYSGDTDTDTSPRPPVKRDVPVRVPMVMISPWSAVPVSTPYFLWHGKRKYVYNSSGGNFFKGGNFFFKKICTRKNARDVVLQKMN
jgi:hypothetical protein